MDRRAWLQLVSVLAAAQPPAPPAKAPRFTRDQVAAALKLIGLEFAPEKIDMMLPGLDRAIGRYENLRKIDVPPDTEPAIAFHPWLPGKPPKEVRAVFKPPRIAAPKSKHWQSVEDLAFLTVTELAPLVKARLVSSTGLTRMYLDRLKRFGPKLNCVVTLTEKLALRQAAQADNEIRRGNYRGPLHGLPWGAKDLFATKGIKTTWGAEPFRDQMIDTDAAVVERLRGAGAVLVAKLSMGALAMGGLWFGGMTKTPWNIERTSSGSSAGSASATAAGLVAFSIGTETLGSIISPSIACGVTGLRPTYGRVSRHGAMALVWTMDKIGPICRSAADCALVLNAIYGPDGRDRTVTSAPLHWDASKPLSRMKIGYTKKAFDDIKGDDKPLYDQALADLRKAGASLEPVEIDDSFSGPLLIILDAEAAAAFDDITRDGKVDMLSGQKPGDWPNQFRTARLYPAVEYIRAQRARTLLQRKLEAFFEKWDAVVCPPQAHLRSTNLTGHPQVVVPCGFVKGLPRGISFLGRLYDEGAPLRVAHAYQSVTDWHRQRPPLK
jgi:Asp-tRNA(Asn)/Glu-tRNA(Gln) amidotransferase A subunit family amidase